MTTHSTIQKAILAISIIAVAALTVLNLTVKTGPDPDVVYPMANQKIEWTWAGR